MTKAYAAGERGANAAEGRVPCAQPQAPCQSSAFASWILALVPLGHLQGEPIPRPRPHQC